jgi:hypothetical protein
MRNQMLLLLCVGGLLLASVTWAATYTDPSQRTAQQTGCAQTQTSAVARSAAERSTAERASSAIDQTLEVVVESPNCSGSLEPPAPEAKSGVLGTHGEKIPGRLVALTLQVSPNQQTTCEIVLRYYSHLKHPVHTRTRYCRSNIHRGRWEAKGPAQHLPRWAILTGSTQLIRMEVNLHAVGSAAQAIAHATVYLSSNAPNESSPVKLTTDSKGRATLLIPYGPNRILTASYPGESGYNAAIAQAEVQFAANTTYFASRRLIASGQLVTFSGALQGRPLPKGHTPATIRVQYQRGRRWVTWGTTHPKGANWKMTLAIVGAPQALTTRALVIPSAKYHYIQGTSRIVHLYITHRPAVK